MSTWIEQDVAIAAAHYRAGQFVETSKLCRQILSQNPAHPDALRMMGMLARRAGYLKLALHLFQQAVQFAPRNLEALNQLGDLLTTLEKFAESETTYRQLIAIAPQSAVGWTNLGNLFRVQGKLDEARSAYQAAIDADAAFAPVFSNLGNLLKDLGQIEAAITAFEQAVELDPSSAQMHSNLVYANCFCPGMTAPQLLDQARGWADRHETPLLAEHRPLDINCDPNRKLKIGYISGDFRDHVVGRNLLPIFENHDHASFEIHCFSTLSRHDAMTPRFIRASDQWHECAGMDDSVLAEQVRVQRIDILVDLTLHMSGNRLQTFARKPAPVQVTWAGYPGTTGLRSIDYRITDPYLDPPGLTDAFYSEKSIRLPHSFWCYRPMDDVPEVNPLPAAAAGFVTFACLNNFGKVTADALNLWADVLIASLDSRMLMVCPDGSRRAQVLQFFQTKGIDRSRVHFVGMTPPGQHMIRYHRIDIALDPVPYTGHTTTLDGFWMGVPVVTLSGETAVARGSVTPLSNLGLTDLIAHTSEQYVIIATRLAIDLPRLAQLRAGLRQRMRSSPLCDELRFTSDLEKAYRAMWNRLVAEKQTV